MQTIYQYMKYYCSSSNVQSVIDEKFPVLAALKFYKRHKYHISDTVIISQVGFPGGSHIDHNNDCMFSKKHLKELSGEK